MAVAIPGKAPRGFSVVVGGGAAVYHVGPVLRGAQPLPSAGETTSGGLGVTGELPSIDPAAESSAAQLLVELDRSYRRRESAPWVPLGGVVVVYFALIGALGAQWPPLGVASATLAALAATAAGFALARYRDRVAGAAYLHYELDGEAAAAFVRLQRGLQRLAACNRVWHVASEGRAGDAGRRYGAKLFLRRYRIRPSLSAPPRVQANLRVPTIYSEHRKYYFFPDRVLAYDEHGVRALPYALLGMRSGQSLCIEDEDVPLDARVVESTWLHARPDGSADPRFANNRRFPVALYGDLEVVGPGGVRELFQCSQPEALADLVSAVEAMAWGAAGEPEWEAAEPEEGRGGEAEEEGPEPAEEATDDELYGEALRAVVRAGGATLEALAAELRVDYGRAALLLATMEREGFIGPVIEERPRQVLRSAERYVAAAFGEEVRREAPRDRGARSRANGGNGRGARQRAPRSAHEVLGLRDGASAEEVAAAYHQMAQMYHPDKVATLAPEFRDLAEARMKEINAAYRSLAKGNGAGRG